MVLNALFKGFFSKESSLNCAARVEGAINPALAMSSGTKS